MEEAHTKPTDEVLHYFQTDENVGLDDDQVKRYQAKYGPNGTYSQGTNLLPDCRHFALELMALTESNMDPWTYGPVTLVNL